MNISNDLAKRGNEWIPRFLLTEKNSEFVRFEPNPKQPSELTAIFKCYANEAAKNSGIDGRTVKVNYQRHDLKKLYVEFPWSSPEEFYEKALDEVNKVIVARYGEDYSIALDEVDVTRCHYGESMASLAVKITSAFWYDRCIVTNVKR